MSVTFRVALYIRVSTDEQVKEGHSISAQQQRMLDYVRSQSWEVADIYIDDGYSAKTLERPAIQRLLEDATKKKFEVLLIYRLDRLVRTVTDLYKVMQHLEKHGVMFKSATEVYDTTSAMGRFFITLVAAIAQWERENLAERVKMGMEENFRKGGLNAAAPFGYKMLDNKLIINKLEASIVRRIFDMYETHGSSYIAKQLNNEGIFTRSGSYWTEYTIRYILENPIYSGKMRWNRRYQGGELTGKEIIIDGNHEAYVTPERQKELLRIRAVRYINREKTTSCYPFSGILYCSRCGNRLFGGEQSRKKTGPYRHYKCRGRFQKGICDLPLISEDVLEEQLLNNLNVIIDGNWKNEITVTSDSIEENIDDIDLIEKELSAIQRRKKKWQLAFGNEVISLEDLKARMEEETEKEIALKTKLSVTPEERIKNTKLSPDQIIDFARNAKKNWQYLDKEHKKMFIHTLFNRIEVEAIGEALGGPGRRTPIEITSFKVN
ncbi:recombinase family protein [Brevibacillus laterosporus]|uniref:recombinase family protein n=1 Tax=Brevibacillus laterosporus TaxID=1465 RepID=UPI000CE2F82A|nr:recombinase family protein [Brevibacillus laterosporus]PPA85908.1 recombinase family protein [Brevibacillus laterosporus]